MSHHPILEVKNLSHVFPNGTMGVHHVNLQVYKGEFIIIAGANGSGKTALIRHLNGLLKPTTGDVLMAGISISSNLIEARKKIGLIFQDSDSQFVGQTVYEEVAFGPENLNLPQAEVAQIVDEVLEVVRLSAVANQSPHTLSGGQKRKLAVAGVLAMKPEIIMFDEPFTGLDYPGVVQVLQQLVALHQAGSTIILVTHELEKVLAHANRLIVMNQGQLVADGRPEDVIKTVEKHAVRMPLQQGERIESLTWLK
ncbi:MAG: energy-coupling factor ABC transporter ATP-binding protein [Defluviitaleaceae bacterium]|nr:energy-coupling factor ABC transporter ATP-binding protein [Defluviitaleaceae bacterium]